MKRKSKLSNALVGSVGLMLLMGFNQTIKAQQQGGPYVLNPTVVAGGGGTSTNGTTKLRFVATSLSASDPVTVTITRDNYSLGVGGLLELVSTETDPVITLARTQGTSLDILQGNYEAVRVRVSSSSPALAAQYLMIKTSTEEIQQIIPGTLQKTRR
jgi:hypothetical protein